MFLKYAIIQKLISENQTLYPKDSKGFSLVELVVVIAISLEFIIEIYSLFEFLIKRTSVQIDK